MKDGLKKATKPRTPMNLLSIAAEVAHCLESEDEGDPCYHCRQKRFLLAVIKDLKEGKLIIPAGQRVEVPAFKPMPEPEEVIAHCIRCHEPLKVEGDEGRCLHCT